MIVDQLPVPKYKLNTADEHLMENDSKYIINPISKRTFDALPKIYGRKNKKVYMPKMNYLKKEPQSDHHSGKKMYPSHSCFQIQEETKTNIKKSMFKDKYQENSEATHTRYKTEMRSYEKELSNKLSKPKPQICTKRYCFCNQTHQNHHQSANLKTNKSLASKSLIPKLRPIRLNQQDSSPFQNETTHKVMKLSTDNMNPNITGVSFGLLELIRKNNNESKSRNGGHDQFKNSFSRIPSRNVTSDKQQSTPYKNQGIQSITVQINKNDKSQHFAGDDNIKSRVKNSRARFISEGTDSDDAKSVSSISSISLSKYIFQNTGQQNTMFSSLNKKQKEPSQIKHKPKQDRQKFNYQKKSGLFVIPQEDEFTTFLKDYEPMNPKFQIKKLVRLPKFKVLKEDDGIYFGEVENQMKQGEGLKVTEKQIFQGKFKNNVKVTGYQRNIDGVYKGQFVNGLRDGQGTFEWNNGELFEGQWKNGTKNGFGIWKSPKGDYYEGYWSNNRQNGMGTFRHKLSTYKGQFFNFLKHGKGQQIFSNGDSYKGQYKDGKPSGKGKYQWADGSYYEGDFESGFRQGQGKWSFINGTTYVGQFKNDSKHGKGRQTYKTGQYYQGYFKDGNKSDGTLYDLQGNGIQIKSS